MSADHLSEDTLALYVMGSLGDDEAGAVELHVASCQRCAAALQREAALDMQLHQIAAAPAPAPSPRPPARRLPRLLGALSAAALTLVAASLLLLAGRRSEAHPRSTFQIACPAGPDGRADPACRAEARRRGLFVQFPPGEPIPIYEASAPAKPKDKTP